MTNMATSGEEGPGICGTCSALIPPESPMGICPACTFAQVARELENSPLNSDPPAPEIDGYQIQKLLGQGGMGDVYLATQEKFDRLVAIKLLRVAENEGLSDELKPRFLQEAKALSTLTHPAIVSVFDFGETETGQPYFVMEYIDGADLRAILAEGPLSPDDVIKYAIQVCEALEFAHGKGIIHRDVKPANVLISLDGYVKLVDFGLAKVKPPEQMAGASLTYSQLAVGTPDYVAPEQILQSGEVDHRADIYGLGVLIYEMATLSIPRGSWVRPSQHNPEFGEKLDAIVEKALKSNPKERFQSARAVKKELGTCQKKSASILAVSGLLIAIFSFLIGSYFLFIHAPDSAKIEIEEFMIPPRAMLSLPFPETAMASNRRPERPQGFPLRLESTPGKISFQRLVDGALVNANLPDVVDLKSVHTLRWISPTEFVAPAKKGGVVKVGFSNGQVDLSYELAGLTDIVQLEASRTCGLALRKDGKVFAWPSGKVHDFFPPPTPLSDVVKLAAGKNHAAALISDGTIRVWGISRYGESSPPYQFSHIVDIDAGNHFTVVLTENGRVFAWGDNTFGQCNVPPNLPPVAEISCLDNSVYALLENGIVRAWGKDVTIDPYEKRPLLYKGLMHGGKSGTLLAERTTGEWLPIAGDNFEDWKRILNQHNRLFSATAPTLNGEFLLNWALPGKVGNESTQSPSSKLISFYRSVPSGEGLGSGNIPQTAEIIRDFAISHTFYRVTSTTRQPNQHGHVLVIDNKNKVIAWGNNDYGQCNVPQIEEEVIDVAAGDNFSMALTKEGQVLVWGSHRRDLPIAPIMHRNIVRIEAGSAHGVALDQNGFFVGIGDNSVGQCTPPEPNQAFELIAAGGDLTVGVTKQGILQVWGNAKAYGRSEIPLIAKEKIDAKKIEIGRYTCWLLLADNTLHSWGELTSPKAPVYPKKLENVDDFWCGNSGLIVRFIDGSYQGYNAGSWSNNTLTKILNNCVKVEIGYATIFATIR